jgi:hypothetical protein
MARDIRVICERIAGFGKYYPDRIIAVYDISQTKYRINAVFGSVETHMNGSSHPKHENRIYEFPRLRASF